MTKKRVALYARVSTRGGVRQTVKNQFLELRRYARRMNWKVVMEIADEESGRSDQRPGLEELMKKAALRLVDAVIVWDLSRLTRGGPMKAFEYIARLQANEVEFWSMNEELFRTSGPAGQLFIALAAHVAQMESERMKERIHAGLARARAEGKTLGRRPCILDREKILRWHREGKSLRQIARLAGCGHDTIARRLKAFATKTRNPRRKA